MGALGMGNPVSPFDAARFDVLLEDSVFAESATETAERYASAFDVLGALAETVNRDGTSRATMSTERPNLVVRI
jgi:hypothetical protein